MNWSKHEAFFRLGLTTFARRKRNEHETEATYFGRTDPGIHFEDDGDAEGGGATEGGETDH